MIVYSINKKINEKSIFAYLITNSYFFRHSKIKPRSMSVGHNGEFLFHFDSHIPIKTQSMFVVMGIAELSSGQTTTIAFF